MLNKNSSRLNMPPGGFPGQMTPSFQQTPGFGPNPQQFPEFGQSSFFPGFQLERLQREIRENRRRIDNLARRVTRIENFLQIRDTGDTSYTPDDNYSF